MQHCRKYDLTVIWLIAHLFLVDNAQVKFKYVFKAAMIHFWRGTQTQAHSHDRLPLFDVDMFNLLANNPAAREQYNYPWQVRFWGISCLHWPSKSIERWWEMRGEMVNDMQQSKTKTAPLQFMASKHLGPGTQKVWVGLQITIFFFHFNNSFVH